MVTAKTTFPREFKLEAVRMVCEQGVSVAQAARNVDMREKVLRKWVRAYEPDPAPDFPGQRQLKPEQAKNAALKREIHELKVQRHILKNPRPTA